jgi:hypothetical protein
MHVFSMSVQCSHEPCRCAIDAERLAQGAKYCSDVCAAEAGEQVCGCGHAECSRAVPAHTSEKETVTTLGEQYSRG